MRFEDAELVSRCLEGDEDSFGKLVERYEGAVFATAFYYVGRYGAAEDIVQDSFFSAYRNLGKLKDRDRFGSWLKGITCRTAANWLSRQGNKLKSETPLPYRRTVSIEDAREGPRGKLEREERLEFVQRAIDSLPEEYRLPVVLRYLQEYSYDEIGEFVGMSRERVRGVLQRAGRQLRDIFKELDSSEGESEWHRVRE